RSAAERCNADSLSAVTITLDSKDAAVELNDSTALPRRSPTRSKWRVIVSRRRANSVPTAWMVRASWDRASWRHPSATVRSSAMSVVGVASTTFFANAYSNSPLSVDTAASRNGSPGTNSTTNSGVGSNARQYALAASLSTCALSWEAWENINSWRSCSRVADSASRYADSGTFASTTIWR